MASTYKQASITDTVASVLSANTNRKKLLLKNIGTSTIYIGGNNSLTSSNGYLIESNDLLYLNDYLGEIFSICATGETSTLNIIEEVLN